jgi:hypothetical protein
MGLKMPLTFFPLFLLNRSTIFLPLNSLCRINVSFSVQMWFFVCFLVCVIRIRIRREEVCVDKVWPSFEGESDSSS